MEERQHNEFQTDSPLDSFVGVWKRVMTEPRGFFRDMPLSGGLQNPLLFLAACVAISTLGFLLVGPRWFAFWFLAIGIVRAFVGAFALMLVARQLFGGVGDYEATYRVVAYANAPVALLWIPGIRPLVWLYGLFLVILGVERAHGFDTVKAVLTVLLSALVLAAVGWMFGVPGGLPLSTMRGCH